VRLNVDPAEDFTVEGDDLHTVVTVNSLEAKLGTSFDLDTPHGSQSLIIDAATEDGSTAEYSDLGLPTRQLRTGDLVVTWKVVEAPTFDITISPEDLACGFDKTFSVLDDGELRCLELSIESGWRPGDELEIAEEFCYVRLNVQDSPYYSLDGDDISLTLDITAHQARRGCTVTLDLPQGERRIIIAAGTISGEEIVYEGLGLPAGEDSSQGDLYVTVTYPPAPALRAVSVELAPPPPGLFSQLRSYVSRLMS